GLTLAVTIILFFGVQITNIPGWQQWFWLVLGGLAEGAFIASNLSDPKAATQAVAREFDAKYDLGQIHNSVSRQRLQSALEYRRNMITLAGRHDGAMRANMQQTIADINDWIGHMYDLALHIDAFDNNELVERDRKMVPQQIEKTQIRLKNETDPSVKKDLEEQLKTLTQQRDNLDATVNSVKRAEIQLESTLSSLGTIYAQMSLLGTKEVDSARAQRLRLEIQDEVASLQDTIFAMDEVQSQRLQLR
ncbi:MAG: hypothetical protein R3E39_32325, partial [Anaerolineae bacterium]